MLSIKSNIYNFKHKLQIPVGEKGVWGKFRHTGSCVCSSSPSLLELAQLKFCFVFEFMPEFFPNSLHLSQNMFEPWLICSILVYFHLKVQWLVKFSQFVRHSYSVFYQGESATQVGTSRSLFYPGGWGPSVRSTQSRVRRSFKNLQTLLSNFFYVPLKWNTKQVYPACRAGRKTHAFSTPWVELSKGNYFL
jgi:hypothetical protein